MGQLEILAFELDPFFWYWPSQTSYDPAKIIHFKICTPVKSQAKPDGATYTRNSGKLYGKMSQTCMWLIHHLLIWYIACQPKKSYNTPRTKFLFQKELMGILEFATDWLLKVQSLGIFPSLWRDWPLLLDFWHLSFYEGWDHDSVLQLCLVF